MIRDEHLVVMAPQLVSVRTKDLGEVAGDLSAQRAELLAALDLLMKGI